MVKADLQSETNHWSTCTSYRASFLLDDQASLWSQTTLSSFRERYDVTHKTVDINIRILCFLFLKKLSENKIKIIKLKAYMSLLFVKSFIKSNMSCIF